ncbi:hypothetical protein [Enterococcus gallinarum]
MFQDKAITGVIRQEEKSWFLRIFELSARVLQLKKLFVKLLI